MGTIGSLLYVGASILGGQYMRGPLYGAPVYWALQLHVGPRACGGPCMRGPHYVRPPVFVPVLSTYTT